jgi:S1-C subfamily serine protease
MKAAQEKAIAEKRWPDAASLARSLAALGIRVESTGEEPELALEYAKEQLEGGGALAGFLSAVRANSLKTLSADDSLFFLRKAVDAKQRRTAAYFLNILDTHYQEGQADAPVDGALREFAQGKDTPQEMIKGVATVWVDRGYRIQRGMGVPDRVLGSAFFVDASGLLITNYHVISSEVDPQYEGYSRTFIRLGDAASARIPAKVVGWDKAMDLALLKSEVTPEYVYSVVDWVVPRLGDTVYAIGSPGGLEKTVTRGIVSALSRPFLQIGDVMQIDAAVNHGNSGGPVVDTEGRLVGIVFAGIEQFQGTNFAVPAKQLAAALPAMIAGGKAERPWLGVSLSEGASGAEIIYVAPSTPAAELQIKSGGVITSLDGREAAAPQGMMIPKLQDILFPLRAGELVTVGIARAGAPPGEEQENYVVRLAARPDVPMAEAAKKDSKERMAAPLFGLVLSPAGGTAFTPAYLVKKVVRGSIADEAGLSENDPVSIRGFKVDEKQGYAVMEINVKKKRMGYMETNIQLPAPLDISDTL